MGMFDGLLGGIVGAGMVSVVNGILEQHGGLQGVVSEFERKGLGRTDRRGQTHAGRDRPGGVGQTSISSTVRSCAAKFITPAVS